MAWFEPRWREDDPLLPAPRMQRRVLVIDDDRDVTAFVIQVASRLPAGVEVEHAGSLPEARARIESGRYDAVLADHYLDASGAGLALRAECLLRQPGARFAMMSSMNARDFDRLPGTESLPFLQKPFSVQQCRDFLGDLLLGNAESPPACCPF